MFVLDMEQINLIQMNEEIIALKNEVARMKMILEEDLEFARRTEEAWQEIDEGKFSEYPTKEFFERLKNDS
jgi:HAMP domain-containing protein